ncbi:MAG TPA: hypothetical protein VFC31_05110 [Candidatus Limnocylindria bacterium]|nr:hypothetical protein [Candidatus Limnocylindria bacterium]
MPPVHDLVIRGGTLYDGSGAPPARGDVAVASDRIAAVGAVQARGARELDAAGLAVAPGFINMLSWATDTLFADGRSQSDIRQGVTLEVFGEGWSLGPLNERMKRERTEQQGDIKYHITWTTLDEALETLVARGISTNIASFVGATTLRMHEIASDDRPPSADELGRMRALVDRAMRDGALGVGSSLIYAPAAYATTDELVALCEAAAPYGGMYISHLRSEGGRLLEAIDELIEIARRARVGAEIYHLKQAGRSNWPKLDGAIQRVESARREGLAITADMYPYEAGATGLDACFPPWAHDGGPEALRARLRDATARAHPGGDVASGVLVGESLRGGRGTRGYPARVLQERAAQAAHREDARRDRGRARRRSARRRDGPRRGGREPRRHDRVHGIAGEPAARGRAAVDELRVRRGLDRA